MGNTEERGGCGNGGMRRERETDGGSGCEQCGVGGLENDRECKGY